MVNGMLGMAMVLVAAALVALGRAHRLVGDLTGENARLREEASHDPLTGLANRRGILAHLDAALARPHSLTAVLYIDLDHFKAVNDSFGHRSGDRVLVEIAHRLRARLPNGANVGRLGGDELVVVLSQATSIEEAAEVAADLREWLGRPMHLEGDLAPVHLTVSIGVAAAQTDGGGEAGDAQVMLDCADEALRRAKVNGRNRVSRFCDAESANLADSASQKRGFRVGDRRD